jgi:DNA-binding winged helix-turn-helix (wHTH) protein/tetratricopeptide (TPR) repeat protein
MQYAWDDFRLDRERCLLIRQGRQVKLSRKVLDCIAHLVEQRDRVVGYDELIQKIWHHDDVTNHQLAQIVLAARRTLGDDGHTQRVIQTVPGLGYRWIANVLEGTAILPPSQTASGETSPVDGDTSSTMRTRSADPAEVTAWMRDMSAPEIRRQPGVSLAEGWEVDAISSLQTAPLQAGEPPSIPMRREAPRARFWAAVGLTLVFAVMVGWYFLQDSVVSSAKTAESVAINPLAKIEELSWRGDVEGVRAGLMALPLALRQSPEARLLEIQMYIQSARFEDASEKLEAQFSRIDENAAPIARARLLILQSTLNQKQSAPGVEVFNPARDAVALMESAGEKTPPAFYGEALSARGAGYMRLKQYDLAIRDLVHARDILLKEGDDRRLLTAQARLAFVWLRKGRMEQALDQSIENAKLAARLDNAREEVDARNRATRIQVELLQWDKAYANSRRSMELAESIADSELRYYTIDLHTLVLTNMGRLREAGALLAQIEVEKNNGSTATTMYFLETADAERALIGAANIFASYDARANENLILINQEGGLLLWMIAAQNMAASGGRMPAPTAAQRDMLMRPQSIPGRIAKGRWLFSSGRIREAESELDLAFQDSAKAGRLFYMTLAAEPLIGILLSNGDLDAVDAVLTSLRGIDPERMDRDYRVSVMRLQAAIASKDLAEIQEAHRKVLLVAGERVPLITAPVEMATQNITRHSASGAR